MTRYVALFRGINVGRAKRIAMADLRALLASLGYRNVRTLLNSGNAVFDAGTEAPAAIAKTIRKAVAGKLGVDALVIVKSAKEIADAVAGNKLGAIATDPSRFLVVFAQDAKSLAALNALTKVEWSDDVLYVGKHAAYAWCANGLLESKLAIALLKGYGETCTTRNWATVGKIYAAMQDSE